MAAELAVLRRWGPRLLALYLALAGVLLAWSAVEARSGLDELERLRAEAGPQELLDGTAGERINSAQDAFGRASSLADNAFLAPLGFVPVLGRQVRAVGSMATAAEKLTTVAGEGVDEASALAAAGLPTGPERIVVLEELAAITDRAAASLAVIDLGSEEALTGPVGDARTRFGVEKTALEETLLDSRDVAQGMAEVFTGPSSYLLLAANNAEMRAGAGMALSAGMLLFENGEVELDDMQSTSELQLPGGVDEYDAEFAALWGFANPDEEWRNLMLSPRYPASADLARDMWAALGRPPVDGVLMVDIAALRELLGALGPVDVDGRRITEDNVVRLLQHDQYVGVESDEQAARRDELGDVADAIVDLLDTSSPDLGALMGGLRRSAAGRNILFWSNDRGLQRAWESIGIGGVLGPSDLLVAVLNEGNNKLDQFLGVEATLEPGPGRQGRLRLEVTNRVGPGEPAYISGVRPEAVGGYGVYPGYLAVSLPGGTEAEVAEGPPLTLGGPDGESQFLAASVRIAPGETVRWTLDLTLPEGVDEVRIAPSARLPATRWTVGDRRWRDDRTPSRRIPWP
jgi:hypothetical protein